MAETRTPIAVKLFVGMISREPLLFDQGIDILSAEFGPLDIRSPVVPWDQTDYYRDEMGTGLFRTFIFFEELMDPARLAEIKVMTNKIEKSIPETQSAVRRRLNLDPGYVTEAKVVLASAKDFSHRVYIGQQIYGEVTLQYREQGRSFIPFDHTYPDFKEQSSIELFNKARERLRISLKREKKR